MVLESFLIVIRGLQTDGTLPMHVNQISLCIFQVTDASGVLSWRMDFQHVKVSSQNYFDTKQLQKNGQPTDNQSCIFKVD